MSTSSSLTFGDYDSTVADKIVKQLVKDSEELSTSLQGFINARGKVVQSQKLALATYDEEIAAINDSESDENFMLPNETHVPVDHNIMRHINASKEMNSSMNFEDAYKSEDAGNDQYDVQSGTLPKKKKGPNIKFDSKPIPSMEEKTNIREKMFLMLEESRINEMRLELDYELAKENGEIDKVKQLEEELFEIQIFNAENLKELITDYQPVSVAKNWGNDSDYVDMLKHLAAIGETPRSMPARKSIGEMHHVHRMHPKL